MVVVVVVVVVSSSSSCSSCSSSSSSSSISSSSRVVVVVVVVVLVVVVVVLVVVVVRRPPARRRVRASSSRLVLETPLLPRTYTATLVSHFQHTRRHVVTSSCRHELSSVTSSRLRDYHKLIRTQANDHSIVLDRLDPFHSYSCLPKIDCMVR